MVGKYLSCKSKSDVFIADNMLKYKIEKSSLSHATQTTPAIPSQSRGTQNEATTHCVDGQEWRAGSLDIPSGPYDSSLELGL